jgi:hypothetical protein
VGSGAGWLKCVDRRGGLKPALGLGQVLAGVGLISEVREIFQSFCRILSGSTRGEAVGGKPCRTNQVACLGDAWHGFLRDYIKIDL